MKYIIPIKLGSLVKLKFYFHKGDKNLNWIIRGIHIIQESGKPTELQYLVTPFFSPPKTNCLILSETK